MLYEDATNLVTEKFNSSMSFAEQAYNVASGLIAQLSSVQLTPNFSTASLNVPTISTSVVPEVGIPYPPQISEPCGTSPKDPAMYNAEISDIFIPGFRGIEPILSIPDAPSINTYQLPSVPSIPSSESLPAAPVLADRSEPTLSEVVIKAPPILAMPPNPALEAPTFNATLVVDDFDTDAIFAEINIVILFLKGEMENTATTLFDMLKNPQMALSDEIIDEMTARDRLKLADEYQVRQDALTSFYANRGWNLPPGIMTAKLNELQRTRNLSEDNIMRDYTIKNWELSQQNWQAVLQVVPQYTSTLIGLNDSILGRTIEIAKYAFEAAMNKYQAAIEIYKQDTEVYKTAYAIYELHVNSQKILIDLYNAEMTGIKLQLEADSIKVDLFKAYLAVEGTKLELYKAKLSGAMAKMEYSKLAMDIYKAQIDGFTAGMSANNAKVQLYQAQLAGEDSKVKLYNSQISGYGALLDTVKVQSSIEMQRAQTVIDINKTLIQKYEADIHRYSAQLQEISTRNDSVTRAFAGQVGLYEAGSRNAVAVAEVLVKQAEVNMRTAETAVDIQVKQADINMHNANVAAQIQSEAMKGAASVAAQLAASAMSAVSAGAHIGATSSSSDARSESTNYSYNYSE